MNKSLKQKKSAGFILGLVLFIAAGSTNLMAQCCGMNMQHKGMPMHGQMNMEKDTCAVSNDNGKDLSIVRKGVIDLKAIDKNNDGKVFQDQMDWNVISDEPGKCPLCKMTLQEVTLKQADENLTKNGFKVKEFNGTEDN